MAVAAPWRCDCGAHNNPRRDLCGHCRTPRVPPPFPADPTAARDEAIAQVERNADERWKRTALEIVEHVCRTMPEWYVDDLWEAGLPPTREDRALGPVLREAARRGWCEKTDRMKPSKRSHLSGKPVWRSLIYEPAPLF